MLKTNKFIWFATLAGCVLYSIYIYDRLPPHIAIQFDFKGQPRSWAPKQDFFLWSAIFLFFMNALFYALSLFMKKIPESLLNVPWKSYWFANEERKTIVYRKMQLLMAWTGILINSISLFIVHITFQQSAVVSLHIPTSLGIWSILIVCVIFVIWSIYLCKPPQKESR